MNQDRGCVSHTAYILAIARRNTPNLQTHGSFTLLKFASIEIADAMKVSFIQKLT